MYTKINVYIFLCTFGNHQKKTMRKFFAKIHAVLGQLDFTRLRTDGRTDRQTDRRTDTVLFFCLGI